MDSTQKSYVIFKKIFLLKQNRIPDGGIKYMTAYGYIQTLQECSAESDQSMQSSECSVFKFTMDKILNRIEENEFYTQETEGDIVRFSKKYVVDDEDHNGQQTTLK